MNKKGVFIFLIFLLLLISCSNGRKTLKNNKAENKNKLMEPATEPTSSPRVLIKKIDFLPDNPTIKTNIEVIDEIENKKNLPIKIIYKFWVNGKVVKESSENFLSPDHFSKKDYIWCDVEVYNEDTGELIAQKRSRIIRIPSSAPEIRIEKFPDIKELKTYYIEYTVEDQDNELEEIDVKIVGNKIPEWVKLLPEEEKIEIDLNKNIKPGNYSFKLKAEDIDGAYSEVEFKFLITKNKTIEKKLIKKSVIETEQKRSPQGAPFDFPDYPKIHE